MSEHDADDRQKARAAFAETPPSWAVWDEMEMHGERCGRCGAWCTVVRPGKTQCDFCDDGRLDQAESMLEMKRRENATLRTALAEAREDTARLNYMTEYCVGYGELAWYSGSTIIVLANLAIGSTLRQAIDRARQEDQVDG